MYHKLVVCRDYNVVYNGSSVNDAPCDHVHIKANCDDYDTALSLLPQLAAVFAKDLADNNPVYFNFPIEFDDRLVGIVDLRGDINTIVKILPDTPLEKFPSGSFVFTQTPSKDTIEVYKITLASGWLTYYTTPVYIGKFTIIPVEYNIVKAFSPSCVAATGAISPQLFNAVIRELEQSLTERNLAKNNAKNQH
ncbi:hypothetical protein E24_00099 [Faustovirus]|nr:hypothetical protein PRJ_Fausto_00089 [Faustovirus]AMN83032.1 hypothetical protein E24_00099 [Faustovirus]AMN84016.1 hypothetical protein D5a_00099 [Faustovirus]AMN85002.1 hypothetical protein E23_00099 [Faustovirus]QBR99003.1 hypothetical protein [Faustovirus mariensis]